jgi:hypothetical protein
MLTYTVLELNPTSSLFSNSSIKYKSIVSPNKMKFGFYQLGVVYVGLVNKFLKYIFHVSLHLFQDLYQFSFSEAKSL